MKQQIIQVSTLIIALSCISACRTERVVTSDGRPMPVEPRPAPPTPLGATPNQMAFMVGSKPEDSNGNGYPDLIRVTSVLFASPHPTAVQADGEFVFRLYPMGTSESPNATPLAEWRITNDEIQDYLTIAQYGPCYVFSLNLLDHRSDVMPLARADMTCRFIPAGGADAVESDGVRSIQLGRGRSALQTSR